ncbi:uncharacterized protein [Venturia canescens]|uniref:uncharacterized protein n=1 Tax=Venturia canescens TaxID=32260 RepID=UPI001C9C107E|nr:uncharacterized protein LOC122411871 [Venturia canescens]
MLATVHPEAARYLSFRSVRSFMQKCRRRHYPPCPRTIEEFVGRLSDPASARYLEYTNGRLSVRLITDESGAQHALFFDENFVRQEMSDVTRLLIDGTFCSRPQVAGVYQLLTVMGIKLNHGFPFVWVVMTKKTQVAYVACLRYIKEHVLPANNIVLAMSDFERGLRNAITEIFPGVHSMGCNTHHDRALYGKAKALGLQNFLRTNEEAKMYFKKVLALAYLPAHLIGTKFRDLKNRLSDAVKRRLRSFNDYYARYWLGIVKPEGFSVYALACRTNNIVESYHSRLQHRMESRPGAWDFVCKLLKLQADVRTDVERLKNNVQIGRHARYSSVFKQRQLIRAWHELRMQQITDDEFLKKAAALKGNVDALIAHHRDDQVHDEALDEHELQEASQARPLGLNVDPDFDDEFFSGEPPHWLRDNAAAFPENDDEPINDNSSDESMVVETFNQREGYLPIEIIEESHQSSSLDDAGNLSAEDNAERENVDDFEEDAQQSSRANDIENDRVIVIDDEEVQQSSSNHASNVTAAGNPERESINDFEEDRQPSSQPNDVGLIRQRRREETLTSSASTSSTEPHPRNRRKNKRRKEMRIKAAARKRVAVANEITRLREELTATENSRREREDNDSCKVCLLEKATHAYWPCGHACCCQNCMNQLWYEQAVRKCPICRILGTQPPRRIFLPGDC